MDILSSVVGTYVNWDVKSLLLFIVIFILTVDYIKNRQPASFPPGPWALPIIGNIFSVDHSRTHESLTQLAGKYGDVFSLRMGQEWMVVLNGHEVLREALVNQGDSLADRPPLPLLMDMCHGLGNFYAAVRSTMEALMTADIPPLTVRLSMLGPLVVCSRTEANISSAVNSLHFVLDSSRGVILSNGHLWKQQRRFALSTLRNFGLGKKTLEPVILDELTYCLKELKSNEGKPFNPHLPINNAVSNIICSLVFGHRFEYTDEKFRTLIRDFEMLLHCETSIDSQFYNSFPKLMRYIPGKHQTFLNLCSDVKAFIREELKDHKQHWDPSDQRDYIDCYLNEIQMNKGRADSTFDEENLVECVLDLFVAGSETTSTTLRWAFLYMAKYPEVQARVQGEIDRVIGQSRPPSMEDRVNLPYTEAVIHEVQRMGNIVPLSVPHMTNKDIQLRGYTIPKGITVIPNLTSVLFDKNDWETPFTFNPRHFLNEEGKFVKKAAFIPFSAGKRQCLGENLAKMELFLFFTSFMQHFTFSMPAGVKPVLDFVFGSTLAPCHYEICATPRI